MNEQMGEALGTGTVDMLSRKNASNYNDASPREAPAVDPHPTVDVSSAEVKSTLPLTPVTSAPGNTALRGDMGAPATVAFGERANVLGDDSLNSGRQPFDLQTDAVAPVVGDLVTGMPQGGASTQNDVAKLNGDITTGATKGGYVPGVNQPTVAAAPARWTSPASDRGVA